MPPKRSPPVRESTASTTAALQREVKLPPFEEERPSAWFKSAEAMFELHGVANRKMWFFYTQWALTSQQKMLVDDVICMDPTPPDAYEVLKERLLSLYARGERERYGKFRQIADLGGRRPSELLAEMRALYPKGEEHSNAFRYEFFYRLPDDIRAYLGEDTSSSAAELAARADARQSATAKKPNPGVHSVEGAGEVSLVKQDNPKKRKRFSKQRGERTGGGDAGSKDATQGGPKAWEKLGLCYAHYKYGSEAYKRNCRPGCARAEN
jgi:hypothetical protein